ncbi:MAG: sporulation protein YunB [Firmicutes bacterium]|nr:sporulation protein YunB [Bacillota bacterium]
MGKWRRIGSLLCFLTGAMLLFLGTRAYVEPNLDEISRLKARGIVTEIIGETVRASFSDAMKPEDYFVIKKDETGKLQLIQADTVMMNRKTAELTVALQDTYNSLKPEKIEIPIGTIFGSSILSQAEKGITIRVLPLSVSKCDFETAFESQGINQTKHQIYVNIETEVRVLQPFSHENFKVATRMLLTELVILGDVPDNYVSVPKEDILDAT